MTKANEPTWMAVLRECRALFERIGTNDAQLRSMLVPLWDALRLWRRDGYPMPPTDPDATIDALVAKHMGTVRRASEVLEAVDAPPKPEESS